MATLKQAEQAREQFAQKLAKLGAHAIGVELLPGKDEWAVVAFVQPSAPGSWPKMLESGKRGRVVQVPLIVHRGEAFRLE